MEIININIKENHSDAIDKIVPALKRGDVCALPSDTSYALCARADQEEATTKIYQIKKRDKNKSLSIFVKDLKMIEDIAELDNKTASILKKYLPGSYTFILKKRKNTLDYISEEKNTIGIRWIKSELFSKIFNEIKFPLTATSANISDQSPIYDLRDLIKVFKNKIIRPDLIVDAGVLDKIVPSTIVDLSDNIPRILRQGKETFII